MLNKRVLILANNPFSDSNSNGRTLKNFFFPEDRERLAQIYIGGANPNFNACAHFFQISDHDVMRAFLRGGVAGRVVLPEEAADTDRSAAGSEKKIRKSPLTVLARNFLWNRKRWRRGVNEWVDSFSPECVLLQAGDAPFMYRFAIDLSKNRNIPLILYNSEDYCFKKHDFMRSRGLAHLLYPLYRRKLRRAVREALAYATTSIYSNKELEYTYGRVFGRPGEHMYTATEVTPQRGERSEGVFSYLGNLGINRHKSLIKIGEALSRIDPTYQLDVYGPLPSEEVKASFDACPAICYHGSVEYATVRRVMKESTLLFHAESFEAFYCRDIRYGFSTKIADSLASGCPFVIFAPPGLSCTKYLRENECACVIEDEAVLEEKLRELIGNRDLRARLVERALSVVKANHDPEKNRDRMAKILNEL